MLMTGGQERTEAEYRLLVESAGPRATRALATATSLGHIEARRASTPRKARTEIPMAHVRTLTPYLIVDGAAAAIEFYRSVFGARETARYTEGSGRVGHAELSLGGYPLHVADEYPEYGLRGPRALGGVASGLTVQVDDADAVVAAAAAAGAKVLKPVQDEFHGDRSGRIEDPFGHVWSVSTSKARVSDASNRELWTGLAEGNAASMQAPVEEVGYYTLAVPDLERGRRFYAGVFGWEFAATTRNGSLSYAHAENVRLPMGLTDDVKASSPHLYYRVGDLAAAAARVRAQGGTTESITESKSGRGLECRDDQGVPFSLWEPAPGF
jgi:PhnB protein